MAGERILHLRGRFYAVEIGKDLEGFDGLARFLELHRVVVRKGIVLCRAEFDGDVPIAVFVDLTDHGFDIFGKNGRGIVFREAAVLAVRGQMRAVGGRVSKLPRRVKGGLVVEVHAVESHISVFVDLTDESLRKLEFVLHGRQRSHVFIAAVLDRHVADGAATDGGKRGLHDAAGVVEGEMQVSAENDDLIVFGKNVRYVARDPHILERGAGLSAERASVYSIVDHGMRQNDDVGVRIFGGDLRQRAVEPILRCLRIGNVRIRHGEQREDMIAVHDAMAVALRFQNIHVNVLLEVIGAEHFVELRGFCFRFRAPMHVVIADGEDHGHFLRIENAFIYFFINVDLFEFAAVAARVDEVADGEDRVNAAEFLDLLERVREKGFVASGIVVAHMNVADRGERKNDFGFVEYIFHERFLSAWSQANIYYIYYSNFFSLHQVLFEKRIKKFFGASF